VPPAVALLNYISSGILLRIFSQTGIFAGFSLHIINFAVRISEAATDRGHSIFRRDRRWRDWRGSVWRDFSLFNPNLI